MNKGTASMKRKKAAAKRAVSQGLIVLGCLLICLIWVLPFLWMLGTSMRRKSIPSTCLRLSGPSSGTSKTIRRFLI